MRQACCLALVLILLSGTAAAETPRKYLRPVPNEAEPCIQACASTEATCWAKSSKSDHHCDDGMRICVQNCDPQLMNSALLNDLEERRAAARGLVFQPRSWN
ncbi:MAG: hypothetical protein Q8Q73_17820 [Stagnimonas sp.]|nr:hypothetical protein [Stagnimonas sp.]